MNNEVALYSSSTYLYLYAKDINLSVKKFSSPGTEISSTPGTGSVSVDSNPGGFCMTFKSSAVTLSAYGAEVFGSA